MLESPASSADERTPRMSGVGARALYAQFDPLTETAYYVFLCPPFSFVSPFVASASSFNLRSWPKGARANSHRFAMHIQPHAWALLQREAAQARFVAHG